MFDRYSAKKNVGFVALGMAFIFVFSMALQIFISIFVSRFAPWMLDHVFWSWAMGSFPMYFCAMPLSILFFRQCRVIEKPIKRKISVAAFLGTLAVCFSSIYVCNIIGELVNLRFSEILGKEPVNEIVEMTTAAPLWVNALFTVVLAPVFEELFFRKLVIDRLLPYGELPAILISGVAFGLIHGNFNQFFYAAAVGVAFGIIYTRTGNIRYSIIMHMILNAIGGVFAAEAQKLLDGGSWGGIFAGVSGETIGFVMNGIYLAVLVAAVIGAIITLANYRKWYIPFCRPMYGPNFEDWVHMILFNPPVWMFLAVCGLMFVM